MRRSAYVLIGLFIAERLCARTFELDLVERLRQTGALVRASARRAVDKSVVAVNGCWSSLLPGPTPWGWALPGLDPPDWKWYRRLSLKWPQNGPPNANTEGAGGRFKKRSAGRGRCSGQLAGRCKSIARNNSTVVAVKQCSSSVARFSWPERRNGEAPARYAKAWAGLISNGRC